MFYSENLSGTWLRVLKVLIHWYRKMSFLYGVLKGKSPSYLFNTIPNNNTQQQTRNSGYSPSFFVKHDYFKNSFSLCNITEWNKSDCYISNSDSFEVLKNAF